MGAARILLCPRNVLSLIGDWKCGAQEIEAVLKTYSGSCHCGKIRFEASIDLDQGTLKCNCSICTKTRMWCAFIPPQQFNLLSDAESQSGYQWTPPGKDRPRVRYHFCTTCGVRMPAWGDIAEFGGEVYAIPIAALDDVDPEQLAAAPITYIDGRHNSGEAPADTRLM